MYAIRSYYALERLFVFFDIETLDLVTFLIGIHIENTDTTLEPCADFCNVVFA